MNSHNDISREEKKRNISQARNINLTNKCIDWPTNFLTRLLVGYAQQQPTDSVFLLGSYFCAFSFRRGNKFTTRRVEMLTRKQD